MNTIEEAAVPPFTILLAEDDDGDARAIRRAFRSARIANNMERALDGVDALEMLRGGNGRTIVPPPRIVISDLNMPRMDGIRLVQELRKDEALRRLIIFILTTSKRDEDKMAAYDLNVAGYISKATAAQDFLNLVNLMDFYTLLVEIP